MVTYLLGNNFTWCQLERYERVGKENLSLPHPVTTQFPFPETATPTSFSLKYHIALFS